MDTNDSTTEPNQAGHQAGHPTAASTASPTEVEQLRRLQQELAQQEAALQAATMQRQRLEAECVQLREKLHALSQTDPLTGVLSRDYFLGLAEREWQRAQRLYRSLAIVLVDLDHFQALNSNYGPAATDAVIREIAQRCQSVLRAIDLIGRYGGDEFIILLQESDTLSAVMVAERLRTVIAATPLPVSSESTTVTASFGIAITADDTPDINYLIEKADTALAKAKQDGRNRVAVA